MCLEDFAIGRLIQTQRVTLAATTSGQEFFGPDPQRVSICITAPQSGILGVSSRNGDVLQEYILLAAGAGPLILHVNDFGELVRGAMFAIHSVGSVTVAALLSSTTVPLGMVASKKLETDPANKRRGKPVPTTVDLLGEG